MKRIISFSLTLIMLVLLFSVFGIYAFAEEHDFCEDLSGDGLCDIKTDGIACGMMVDGFTSLKGHSISLAENIIIYFTVELSEEAALSSTTSATVTLPDGSESIIPLSKAIVTPAGYVFRADVAAKEMTDTVTLIISYTDEYGIDYVSNEYTYSVAEYCEDYLASAPAGEYAEIIGALKNYGAMAQRYFGYKTDNMITDEPDVSEVILPSQSAVEKSGAVPGISHIKASLVLESETVIRHYFVIDDGAVISDYSFSTGTAVLEPKESGSSNSYYVDIEGISPTELATEYTVKVTKAEESYTCSYSAIDYAVRMANKDGQSSVTVDLCKAIYAYYAAADKLVNK